RLHLTDKSYGSFRFYPTWLPQRRMATRSKAMIELNDDQLRALDSEKQPVSAVDPRTGQEYLLIKLEVYDLVRGVVASFNKRVEADPDMDVYEQYRNKS